MQFVIPMLISIERLEHEIESHCEGSQEDEVDEEDVENILDNFLYRHHQSSQRSVENKPPWQSHQSNTPDQRVALRHGMDFRNLIC